MAFFLSKTSKNSSSIVFAHLRKTCCAIARHTETSIYKPTMQFPERGFHYDASQQ